MFESLSESKRPHRLLTAAQLCDNDLGDLSRRVSIQECQQKAMGAVVPFSFFEREAGEYRRDYREMSIWCSVFAGSIGGPNLESLVAARKRTESEWNGKGVDPVARWMESARGVGE